MQHPRAPFTVGPACRQSPGGTQALGAGRLLLPVRPPFYGSEGSLTLLADPPAQERYVPTYREDTEARGTR